MGRPHSGMSLSLKKEGRSDPCDTREPAAHCAPWNSRSQTDKDSVIHPHEGLETPNSNHMGSSQQVLFTFCRRVGPWLPPRSRFPGG